MTVFELCGGAGGALIAAATVYRLVTSKAEAMIGKPGAHDSSTLRDMVARVEGKLDAHTYHNAEFRREVTERLENIEARVFSPPPRRAVRPPPL